MKPRLTITVRLAMSKQWMLDGGTVEEILDFMDLYGHDDRQVQLYIWKAGTTSYDTINGKSAVYTKLAEYNED